MFRSTQKDIFKRRLYQFVIRLINFLNNLPRNEVTKVIINQLLRSGTSILANYVEALSASSRKDYTNGFNHSLKSANESKVWLALIRDTQKIDKKEVNERIKEVDEVSRIFASSILTLRGRKSI